MRKRSQPVRGSNLEGGLKGFENLLKWPRDHENRLFHVLSGRYDPLKPPPSAKLFAFFSHLNNRHWVGGCMQVLLCVIALRGAPVY